MRPAAIFALLSACLAPALTHAGDLTVVVRDQQGAPVADAVVTVAYPGGKTPAHYAEPLVVSQRNLMFVPFVLAVPVGASVRFANEDKVRHQVYSFSPAKTFELKLFGRDQSHSVTFDKAGTVALGCNIHDKMVAFVRVVDTPVAVKTDASGAAAIPGLPAGPATVRVWQPYLRAPGGELSAQVVLPQDGKVERAFSAAVLAPRGGM